MKALQIAFAFAALMVLAVAGRAEPDRGPAPPLSADVLAVIDGDTITVRIIDGPCGREPCPGQIVDVRLAGIDTPEVHRCRKRIRPSCAACDTEQALGHSARDEAARLTAHRKVRLYDIRADPYAGRLVARLVAVGGAGEVDVGAALIGRGLAVAYDPEASGSYAKAKPWCEAAE